ncbi:ornithine cyclodeaminase family protein [Pseudomonas sp. GOM7]|uniref:ornithine cyclodeaminase family protein n=1 Tax=Pseudomonas sp. GOM7 TaxID=2998079 RepID=UPI00227D2C1E|nr:ornithine cyclodeaminase family protein [Pseudomonas sp. GOM7]WAJ39300.1 ornithine cyclodeaminase family protein [Pseudomonas sp. GOM7]
MPCRQSLHGQGAASAFVNGGKNKRKLRLEPISEIFCGAPDGILIRGKPALPVSSALFTWLPVDGRLSRSVSSEVVQMKTLLLNKAEVGSLITMQEVIGTVEEAYKAFSAGQVVQPDYIGIHLSAPRGEIDFKVGYCTSNEIISMKASSGGFLDNPSTHGVPNGMGSVLLFDARSCALICVMDGSLLTGLRTGASGAVSVKALARANATKVTCIGTGNQARMQIRAISLVRPIEVIHAWSRTPETRERFKADIEGELGIPVILADSKKEAVEQADILITTTRGKGPLVQASWVKPGTHIVAIGTDMKGKQEFEPEIFRHAKIVNDSIAQCIDKGETWHALNERVIGLDDIHGELGEILLGTKPGRQSDEEITLFDSTGMAIQDNTTAEKIYRNALEKQIGTFFGFL